MYIHTHEKLYTCAYFVNPDLKKKTFWFSMKRISVRTAAEQLNWNLPVLILEEFENAKKFTKLTTAGCFGKFSIKQAVQEKKISTLKPARKSVSDQETMEDDKKIKLGVTEYIVFVCSERDNQLP